MLGKNNYLQKNPWGKLTQKPMFYTPVSIYFVQILICRILQMRGHPWRIYLEGALWLHHKLLHRPGLTKKSISMRSWNTVAWRELGKSHMSLFVCLSFCYLLLYICSIKQPMMSWLLLWLLDVTGGLGRSPDTSAITPCCHKQESQAQVLLHTHFILYNSMWSTFILHNIASACRET